VVRGNALAGPSAAWAFSGPPAAIYWPSRWHLGIGIAAPIAMRATIDPSSPPQTADS
jgi:hypothetical protein